MRKHLVLVNGPGKPGHKTMAASVQFKQNHYFANTTQNLKELIIRKNQIPQEYFIRMYYLSNMKPLAIWMLIVAICSSAAAQNTIGLPLIINYGKNDFHGGAQTWDIKQDHKGLMYF